MIDFGLFENIVIVFLFSVWHEFSHLSCNFGAGKPNFLSRTKTLVPFRSTISSPYTCLDHVPQEKQEKTEHKNWLVVGALKNMKVNWDDYSQYMAWENQIHVPNHQPVKVAIALWLNHGERG